MKVQIKRNFGANEITVTEEVKSQLEFFKLASFFSDLPKACGNCGKEDLAFSYRRTSEDYEYCEIECQDCEHVLKFGQHKEGKTLFPKGWEPPYEADEDSEDGDDDEEEDRPSKKSKKSKDAFKPKKRKDDDEEDEEEDSEEDESEEDEDSEDESDDGDDDSDGEEKPKRNINDIAAKFGIKTKN